MQEDDFEIFHIKGKNYNVTIRPVTCNTLRDAKNAKNAISH